MWGPECGVAISIGTFQRTPRHTLTRIMEGSNCECIIVCHRNYDQTVADSAKFCIARYWESWVGFHFFERFTVIPNYKCVLAG